MVYYLKREHSKVVSDFRNHIVKMFKLYGEKEKTAMFLFPVRIDSQYNHELLTVINYEVMDSMEQSFPFHRIV